MSIEIKKRIFGLDILRCAAILFVLFSHTSFLLPVSQQIQHFIFLYFGFTGVEFFFVLSGYLVGKIALELFREHSFSFKTAKYFLVRRWFRTLPGYYLSIILYTTLFYFSDHRFIFSDPHNLLYLIFFQNFFTPHPNFFILAWSLSVEEWFYILLPVWLIFFYQFAKTKTAVILPSILIFIIAIILLRVFIVYNYNPEWDAGIRRIVPLRLDSLMTGVLMAYIHIHYKESWTKYATSCLAYGLIIVLMSSGWLYFNIIKSSGSQDFFSKTFLFNFFSLGVALCLPYMSGIKVEKNYIIGKFVRHISLVSYSIYLLHTLIVFLVITVCNKLIISDVSLLKFILSWICCILGATIMYKYYERPLMLLREKFRL